MPSADRLFTGADRSSPPDLFGALQTSIHALLRLATAPEPRPCLSESQARDILLDDALARDPEFDGAVFGIRWPWEIGSDSVFGRSWVLAAVGAHPGSRLDQWDDLVTRAKETLDAAQPDWHKSGGGVRFAHADDFTWVVWYGERFSFSKGNQAEAVRHLWAAWEASGRRDGCGLAQETIAERIGTSEANANYRLATTFRGGHPAWGTMIREVGKGVYALHRTEPGA